MKNPIKWIRNRLCKHKGMQFMSTAVADLDEFGHNANVAAMAHCPDCKTAWCGDVSVAVNIPVKETPTSVEALLAIPKAVDRPSEIIEILSATDPIAKEFFGDAVNNTNFKRNFEGSKDFQRMIELYVSTDSGKKELIDMIRNKPA